MKARYTIEVVNGKYGVYDQGLAYEFYDTNEEAEAEKAKLEAEAKIDDFITDRILDFRMELLAELRLDFGIPEEQAKLLIYRALR